MATMYDKNLSRSQVERFVALSERSISEVSKALVPGAMLVNALPFLRHIPAWFPGAGFHTFAAECREYTNEMVEVPFKYVKDQLVSGPSAFSGRLSNSFSLSEGHRSGGI